MKRAFQLAAIGQLLAAGSLLAQQAGDIEGLVQSGQPPEPVAAASVVLEGAGITTVTSASGQFHFHNLAPGRYVLSVRRLGYGPQSVSVEVAAGRTTDVRISLQPIAFRLPQIVVTGVTGEVSEDDVLRSTSVLSREELDRRLDANLGTTLAGEPGVNVSSLGPSTGRPVIRGLSGDRILLLEDGQRTGDLSSTSADHAVAIDPMSARQIEVVRGPMSLLYGSNALGGVVNVIRDEIPSALPGHMHGSLSAQAASVNSGIATAANLTSSIGRLAVRFEGSGRAAGDIGTPAGDLMNTGATSWNAGGAASLIGEHGHAGMSYRYLDSDYGIPGGFVGGHATGVDIAMRRHVLRGELERRPENLLDVIRVRGQWSDYAHQELEPGGTVGTAFDQTLVSGELFTRHAQLGPLSNGATGLRFQYRDIQTGGTLRTPSTWDVSAGGFVVEELGTGALRLQVGGRYDWARYEPRDTTAFISAGGERIPVRPRTFGALSGAVGVIYSPVEPVRVGASASRAYRTPDFNELYSNGPHLAANSFDVGDPSLESESGLGLEAFARFTTERARLETAAFVNWLDNYIFPSSRGRAELGSQGGRPRFQYTNEDARFTGLEGQAELNLFDGVSVTGTLSWVAARFTSEPDSIPIITATDTTFVAGSPYPPLIPPLSGRVEARYDGARWFGGAGLRFAASQERLGNFEEVTGGYVSAMFDAGVRFLWSGMLHSLVFRVDNAANREYRDHLSRIKSIMPEPGRNISLLWRASF